MRHVPVMIAALHSSEESLNAHTAFIMAVCEVLAVDWWRWRRLHKSCWQGRVSPGGVRDESMRGKLHNELFTQTNGRIGEVVMCSKEDGSWYKAAIFSPERSISPCEPEKLSWGCRPSHQKIELFPNLCSKPIFFVAISHAEYWAPGTFAESWALYHPGWLWLV